MQQRKQFDFTTAAAAEIEVNTNFVLPQTQRGSSKILSRVTNYRKIQRDSTQRALLKQNQEIQEPPSLKPHRQSEIQSATCKNFLFSDATQVNSYENLQSYQDTPQTTSPHGFKKLQKGPKTSKHSKLGKSHAMFQRSGGEQQEGDHPLNKYASAVKQASKQLRNNLVSNHIISIKSSLQQSSGEMTVPAPQPIVTPVAKSRINNALKMSVSQTHQHVKSAVATNRRSTNLNSIHNPMETPRMLLQNPLVPTSAINIAQQELPPLQLGEMKAGHGIHTTMPGNQASIELLRANSAKGKTQRIQTIRVNKQKTHQPLDCPMNSDEAQMLQSEYIFTNRQSQNSATMRAADKATQDTTVKPTLNSNTYCPDGATSDDPQTHRSEFTLAFPQPQQQAPSYPPLSQSQIKRVGNLEIYIPKAFMEPSLDMTHEDLLMNRFVSFVQKGYLKQAETALANCDPRSPGYQFNCGLLRLLQKKPQEAFNALLEMHSQCQNARVAEELIEKMKVTHDCNPISGINESYFKCAKAFPAISKSPIKSKTSKAKSVVKPNEWDFFLFQVNKYRKDELQKFIKDKKYFDKVLQRMNHIDDGPKKLIPNVTTNIISEPGVTTRETDKIIQVTNERSSELTDAPNMAADKSLEEVFKELINIQSTYCVGANMDPIVASYEDLIEGLRTFNEKFNVEKFVEDFLTTAAKHDVNQTKELLRVYDIADEAILRARTFIISCFDMEDPGSHDLALNFLLSIVRQAEEEKLKRFMDPDRYAIEKIFNHLVQDIQAAHRNEKGAAPMSDDDQHWIDRLNFHKDLSGRSLENFLSRVLCVTKQELNQYNASSKFIERPENFDRIETGRCPKPIRLDIQRKVHKAWEDHCKKPLTWEEQQEVLASVAAEVAMIEKDARVRYEANREYLMKVEAERVKEETHKNLLFFEAKTIIKQTPMRIALKKSIKRKVFRETAKMVHRRKKEAAEAHLLFQKEEEEKNQHNANTLEDSEESDVQESDEEEFIFQEEHMLIEGADKMAKTGNLWSDHPKADKLRETLFEIQKMCGNEQLIMDRDNERLKPLLAKFGAEAEAEKDEFEKMNPPSEQPQIKVERPKIGVEMPWKQMELLIENLKNINSLFPNKLLQLDQVLVEKFRFFSIIDKNVRLAIYKSCELVHYAKSETLVEQDVDETEFVYIVLQGRVDYMMYKYETRTTVVAATYRAGEVFGDASIQRQFFDVLKCLSKDRNYLQTACDDVYTLRIPKDKFISAIFAEMRVELMFKILLFRKTPYFQELSPYSLIMFASICEVKDYKYGEIIVAQGEKPQACYLVAHGRCQSVYQYVQQQSTEVSKYARKVLRSNIVPRKGFQIGKLDYSRLPLDQAREAHQEAARERSHTSPEHAPLALKDFKESPGSPQQDDSVIESPVKIKRGYYHGVLSKDEQRKKMEYENHIEYDDVTPGKVFGVRTLLDYTTFNKQIQQNSIRFSEQLGINQEEYFDRYKQQILQEERDRETAKRQLTQQTLMKEKIQEERFLMAVGIDQEDSLEQTSKTELSNTGTNHSRDEEGPQQSEREWGCSPVEPQRTLQKESLDDICQRQFIDHMHDSLMKSQTSIQVMSATAKLIVIRREDKTFLNEALKQSIDRVILEQDFKDFDRPVNNFKEMQQSVDQTKQWIQFKKKTEHQILREGQQQRQLNKV